MILWNVIAAVTMTAIGARVRRWAHRRQAARYGCWC